MKWRDCGPFSAADNAFAATPARCSPTIYSTTSASPIARASIPIGRATGVRQVIVGEFNCLGRYSDAKKSECGELTFVVKDGAELVRRFGRRRFGVLARRAPYGHAGQFPTLARVLDHYNRAPRASAGHSELRSRCDSPQPQLRQLEAFLRALDGPGDRSRRALVSSGHFGVHRVPECVILTECIDGGIAFQRSHVPNCLAGQRVGRRPPKFLSLRSGKPPQIVIRQRDARARGLSEIRPIGPPQPNPRPQMLGRIGRIDCRHAPAKAILRRFARSRLTTGAGITRPVMRAIIQDRATTQHRTDTCVLEAARRMTAATVALVLISTSPIDARAQATGADSIVPTLPSRVPLPPDGTELARHTLLVHRLRRHARATRRHRAPSRAHARRRVDARDDQAAGVDAGSDSIRRSRAATPS